MDQDKFKTRYVLRSKVAVISNCSESWPARNWSLEGLLALAGGRKMWKTNFVDSSGVVEDKEEQGQLHWGHRVLQMLRENTTIRIFDPLAEHEHRARRRLGDWSPTDKLELLADYRTPEVLGPDMFRACGQLTDYQWTLLSGPRTGTDLHLDPPFANSWNTVLQGHKLWALLPPDTEPSLLQCDPACSGSEDEVSPLSWFLHLLPQVTASCCPESSTFPAADPEVVRQAGGPGPPGSRRHHLCALPLRPLCGEPGLEPGSD